MEAAKYCFILIAVSAILLLFWGCFSPNNAQGDWPSQNFMDEYSAANTRSFTAFESQASYEEKTLKLRIERDISTIVFKMIVILIVSMKVVMTAVLAVHRANQQKHTVKHKQLVLYHCFKFRRDQQFRQTFTVCPATISFASNFVSGSFQQPGSIQELYKEGVRLATFKDFPVSIPVSALRLAQAGFYYLGEGDQVKCFNCGTTYQGWQLGDRPAAIHARISPSCSLVQGNDRANLPLPLPVTNLPNFSVTEPSMECGYGSFAGPGNGGSRSASVMDPDSGGPSQLLTSAGFSYARDSTRSWFPSSSNGSAAPAAASAAILSGVATPAPANIMLSGAPPHTHTTPMDRGRPRHLSRRLDPRDAVYPQYTQRADRKRSFSIWTSPSLPPVDELVNLGFFYAGYADCVRCFFCGVGLKSWEPDDIPAEEHARWRPTCQYLRLIKGDEFVDAVASSGRNMASGMNPPRLWPSPWVRTVLHECQEPEALIPRRAVPVIAQCEEDQREGRLRGQQRQTLRQSPPVLHQHHTIVPAEAVAFPCGHRLCLYCMPGQVRHCPVCRQCVIRLVPE